MTAKSLSKFHILAALIILAGISVRFFYYQSDRYIWSDEAEMVLDVLQPGASGILPPTTHKMYPPGFMAVEKLLLLAFGHGEGVVRFLPLFASVLSLVFAFLLISRELRGIGGLAALVFLSVSAPLVIFSTEAKHYSLDVLVAVFLLYILPRLEAHGRLAAFVGAVAVWFSWTGIFTLLAFWVAGAVREGRRHLTLRRFTVLGVWLASFAACYKLSIAPWSNPPAGDIYWSGAQLKAYFAAGFFKARWYELGFLPEALAKLQGLLVFPAGLNHTAVASVFFGCGCIYTLMKKNHTGLTALLCILGITAAAALNIYPMAGRVALFAAPALIFLVGQGIAALVSLTSGFGSAHSRVARFASTAGVALSLAVVVLFSWQSARKSISLAKQGLMAHSARGDFTGTDIRPLVRYLDRNVRPDDKIWIDHGDNDTYRYYTLAKPELTANVVYLPRSEDDALKIIAAQEFHGRHWFLLSGRDAYPARHPGYTATINGKAQLRRKVQPNKSVLLLYEGGEKVKYVKALP